MRNPDIVVISNAHPGTYGCQAELTRGVTGWAFFTNPKGIRLL